MKDIITTYEEPLMDVDHFLLYQLILLSEDGNCLKFNTQLYELDLFEMWEQNPPFAGCLKT